MSHTQGSKSLELQSQSQLLERLRAMTRFGSNIVILNGHVGAGKTWLLERYYRQFLPSTNKATLSGQQSLSIDEVSLAILKQLIPSIDYDPNQSIFENLDRELGLQTCEFVVLIDDAGLLSQDILMELWGLVERCQAHPTWSFSLILSSGPDLLAQNILSLHKLFNVQPTELKIEPLPTKEAEFFLELLVLRKFECLDKREKIRKKAQRMESYPRNLIALGSELKQTKGPLNAHSGSVKNGVMFLTLLIFAAAIGSWLFSSGDSPMSQTASQPEVPVAQTIPATAEEGKSETPAQPMPMTAVDIDTVINDDAALPPPVTSQTVTVGENANGRQRIIVPDQVVDSLIEDNDLVAVPSMPPKKASASQVNPSQITFSFAREELLNVSSQRYTVQLGAQRSMQEVQNFINKHDFHQQVRIYPTLRAGKKWYIITYQDFRFVKQASAAIAALPAEIQEVGPWVKSMAQVHKEIEIGK